MTDHHFYEVAQGHGLKHDPFKAIIVPRPIGWISSQDREGRVNLAPYSYFNAFCDKPPIVGFSSMGWKDSVGNIEATGEFVCNLATRKLAEAMNLSSGDFPHGVDEMAEAELAAAPSRLVKPPRVAAAAAALECKLISITRLVDMEGNETNNYLTLGQVVAIHIDRAHIKDGIFDTAGANPIARCGYRGDYAEVASLFEMIRPVV